MYLIIIILLILGIIKMYRSDKGISDAEAEAWTEKQIWY